MPSVYRFLLLDQLLVPIALNFALNWGLAWAYYDRAAIIPLWGADSMVTDTLATTIVLPWVTCLINSAMVKRQMKLGRVPRLGVAVDRWPWRLAPRSVVVRGFALALTCLVVVAFPTLSVLDIAGLQSFEYRPFLILKASYAGVLAGLISPVIAVLAATEAPNGASVTHPLERFSV